MIGFLKPHVHDIHIMSLIIVSVFFIPQNILSIPLNVRWLIPPIGSVFLFLGEYILFLGDYKTSKLRKKALNLAIVIGVLFSFYDWVIENLGAMYGYWVSNQSNFFILAVPFEVSFGAVLFGATVSLIIFRNKTFSLKRVVVASFILAITMMLVELYNNFAGIMTYGNGWWSLHAFLAYFGTWLFLFPSIKFLAKRYLRV